MKKRPKLDKNFKLLVTLLVTIGLLGAAIYLVNNSQQTSWSKRSTTPVQGSVKDHQTINCAQKIDQNADKSLISQNPGDTNCLYLGCGGFFQ